MAVTRSQIRNREVDQHKKQPNKKKKKVSVVRRCSSSREEEVREEEVKGNNAFDKLSADVVTSIFLRCPEKTLSMLRCTSKSWNYFIMTPSFIHSHLTQSMQNRPILLFTKHKSFPRSGRSILRFISIDMEGNIEDLFTVSAPDTRLAAANWRACSGLVCLSTDCRIYLCNPLLHQLRELPNCSPSATVGYDLFGIGYLPSRKVYKVVHFFYKGPQVDHPRNLQLAQLRCEVFTLNREASCHNIHNRWKETAETPRCHPLSPGLSVNETMYWFANVRRAPPDRILSFDFENGNFLTISRPSSVPRGTCMMDLEGMLCLPDIDRFLKTNSILDLWILKDKMSSTWMKEYSINLDNFRPERFAYPYFKSWNGEIVFAHSGMVVFYDLKRKCFRQVKRLNSTLGYAVYSKSLFSLGEM